MTSRLRAVRVFSNQLASRSRNTSRASRPVRARVRAGSWIDAERGAFWLRGVAAARANRTEEAEQLLLSTVWSKWGHKYKYANRPADPEPDRAKQAYERSLHWRPDYGFAHYELGNIALEAYSAAEQGSKAAKEHLTTAVTHFADAVKLSPDSLLFVNNLGVALINHGKAEEAMTQFRKVLELHQSGGSFIAIKGLDPEAGAHLNIGHALMQLGQHDAAHEHWIEALGVGNYEHAVQAVQRLVADGAEHKLPHSSLLDLRFGDALEKEGRIRDAALRFAAAHVGAANLTVTDPETADAVRASVKARMDALAEVWDEGDGALAETRSGGGGGSASKDGRVQVVQTRADGTTSRTSMTQEEMMASVKAQQSQPP